MPLKPHPTPGPSRLINDQVYLASFALLVLIGLLVIWQAVTYRGVIAVVAEWQFDVLGRYHPILTYLLVMGIVGLPLYLLGFVRKRSARRRAALPLQAMRRARRLSWILLTIALALAIMALAAFAMIWTLPPTEGALAAVRVAGTGVPPTGPVRLQGDAVYDRIITLDEQLWFLRRDLRFIPVVAPGAVHRAAGRGSTRSGTLRYFVAVPRIDPTDGAPTPREWTGTLRQGGLPGEVIRLYRYAGYNVDKPYYVLFTEPDILTWHNRMLAMQFMAGALIFLLGGLLQRAHVQRMRRALGPTLIAVDAPAAAPTATS